MTLFFIVADKEVDVMWFALLHRLGESLFSLQFSDILPPSSPPGPRGPHKDLTPGSGGLPGEGQLPVVPGPWHLVWLALPGYTLPSDLLPLASGPDATAPRGPDVAPPPPPTPPPSDASQMRA